MDEELKVNSMSKSAMIKQLKEPLDPPVNASTIEPLLKQI